MLLHSPACDTGDRAAVLGVVRPAGRCSRAPEHSRSSGTDRPLPDRGLRDPTARVNRDDARLAAWATTVGLDLCAGCCIRVARDRRAQRDRRRSETARLTETRPRDDAAMLSRRAGSVRDEPTRSEWHASPTTWSAAATLFDALTSGSQRVRPGRAGATWPPRRPPAGDRHDETLSQNADVAMYDGQAATPAARGLRPGRGPPRPVRSTR